MLLSLRSSDWQPHDRRTGRRSPSSLPLSKGTSLHIAGCTPLSSSPPSSFHCALDEHVTQFAIFCAVCMCPLLCTLKYVPPMYHMPRPPQAPPTTCPAHHTSHSPQHSDLNLFLILTVELGQNEVNLNVLYHCHCALYMCGATAVSMVTSPCSFLPLWSRATWRRQGLCTKEQQLLP